jgi:uncharacterized protein with GYD domain
MVDLPFAAQGRSGGVMPKYLLEVNYTLVGIKGLKSEGGSARETAAAELVKSLGGKMEAFYFAFGGTDASIIAEFPDPTSMAAAALTAGAGGGVTVRTVVLLTAAEIDDAVSRKSTYQPQGS